MPKRRAVIEACLVGVLGVAAFGSTLALVHKSGDYAFFNPIIDVKTALASTYVDDLTPEKLRKMQEGAITGMLEALEDPYTVYVPPADTAAFNKDIMGEYVGIGAQVNVPPNGVLTIVSPLEDSPALHAGMLPDDKVIEIEGKTTVGLTVEDCIKLLMGKEGTKVDLVVERGDRKIPMTIIREQIKTVTVKGIARKAANANKWDFIVDPASKIAYIRLTQFTRDSSRELAAALDSVGASRGELKGLILDLRSNPGGLLEEATAMADLFLTSGTIVSTKGRAFPEKISTAKAPGTLPDFPMAVLINGQSASASEILAGALVENNRAITVGTRSFGKGSVQVVRNVPVPDEGGKTKYAELKITEQAYYLPSGRNISRKGGAIEWGVDPSKGYFVPLSNEETLDMLRARRDQDILRASGGAAVEPLAMVEKLKDPQLTAALKAVQGKIASGQWVPTGKEGAGISGPAAEDLKKLIAARDHITADLIRIDKRVEELERGLGDAAPKPVDLWPDSVDMAGGRIQVFDKDGKLVATLDVNSNSLERWLMDADVKKHEEANPK